MLNLPHPDQRKQNRRSKPTSPLTTPSLFGKRKNIRRDEDRLTQPYVDLYSFSSVLSVLVTLILSVTDAIFTLKLISLGGKRIKSFYGFFFTDGAFSVFDCKISADRNLLNYFSSS